MTKVFISYNVNDKKFSQKLAASLKEANMEVWFDEWKIKAGESITSKVQEGIEEVDNFILVMSKKSMSSNWVAEELRAALSIRIYKNNNFVIPVYLEDCEIPLFLRDYKFADFRNNKKDGYIELLQSLGYIKQTHDGYLSLREIRGEVTRVDKGSYFKSPNNIMIDIPYEYNIDIYPVTRRKFFSFIYHGGYTNPINWHSRGWERVTREESVLTSKSPENLLIQRFGEEFVNDTDKWDYPINKLVTYEAEAYATWVGGRLPLDAEWDKAFRGKDTRKYPWGDNYKKNHCHEIADLSFNVSNYPNGASPYGCFNMAGNKTEMLSDGATDRISQKNESVQTIGWLDYLSTSEEYAGVLDYSPMLRAPCFSQATIHHPITFRCVYPLNSPFEDVQNDGKKYYFMTATSKGVMVHEE